MDFGMGELHCDTITQLGWLRSIATPRAGMHVSSPLRQLYILYIIAGKHLYAASSTENVEENTFRHGLARRTKFSG